MGTRTLQDESGWVLLPQGILLNVHTSSSASPGELWSSWHYLKKVFSNYLKALRRLGDKYLGSDSKEVTMLVVISPCK